MKTIKELKKAISLLPPEKLSEFRAWYEKFDAKQWDEQFVRDANEGKLDTIANKAIKNYRKSFQTEL